MNKTTQIVLGAVLALAGLWIGGYTAYLFPFEHWASFPAFATCFAAFGVGFLLIATAF